MFKAVREHINATTCVMVIALVFAMTGGAYAAKKYLITSTKQISPKVLKSLTGKMGPQGNAGSAGPEGKAGANGKDGAPGTNGKDGAPGTSVTSEAAGAECKAGGTKFTSASGTSHVCNGENGQTGFTEILPPGKTEKGEWSLFGEVPGTVYEGEVGSSVSFNIPLAAAPTVVYVREKEKTPAGCVGNVEEPGAEEGHLCIFATQEINTLKEPAGVVPYPHICTSKIGASCASEFAAAHEADPYGFVIATLAESTGLVLVGGSWAVTAGK